MGSRGTRQRTRAARVWIVGEGPCAREATSILARDHLEVEQWGMLPDQAPPAADLVIFAPAPSIFPACAELRATHAGFLPMMVVLDPTSHTSRAEVLQSGADDVLRGMPEEREFRLRVANWVRIKRTHGELLKAQALGRETHRPPSIEPKPSNGPNGRLTMYGLIETRLRTEYARAVRQQEALAFAYFSVDDDKHMLKRFGNRTVDLLAEEILTRMQDCFREGDQVAQIDTLGFVAILPFTHFEGALAVSARAHKRMSGLYRAEEKEAGVSFSVGVSLFPSPQVGSYKDLGSVAEAAASQALDAGGNRICVVQNSGYVFEPDE